jgi:hypothetical protein
MAHQQTDTAIFTKQSGRIRLACLICGREDFDGVDVLPSDWEDIEEVQTYEESISEIAPDDPDGDVTAWHTHLGVCPDCQKDPDKWFAEMMENHNAGCYKTAERLAMELRNWLQSGGAYPADEDESYVDLMIREVLEDFDDGMIATHQPEDTPL